jgi:predicted secreted protein
MKMAYSFAAVLLLAACLLFAGCTGTCTTMLYDDDNGKTVDVSKDCEIIIELTENPTTGYTWELTAPGLTYVSDEYVPDANTEGLVGAGGVHVFTYKAENTGIFNIEGIYKRSWENTSTDDTTWSATVVVK